MATILILFFSLIIYSPVSCSQEKEDLLSAVQSIVFGPGIDPNKHPLPIQYVYIQLKTSNGNNYTKSINDDELTLTTKQSTDRNFITMYKHYVGDGLYLWRYRINRELENLSIIIKLRGEHVGDSPYKLGNVLTEKCHCPSRTIDEWLADFQCQSNYEQIESNLRPYKAKGIQINDLYEKVRSQFSRSHGVHYSIINNQLYAKTFGSIVDFRYMSDMILTSLINKVILPDMELIIQVGDWPQDEDSETKDPFPFISWCGSEYFRDIVWPQYDLLRGTIQAMERVSLDLLMIQQTHAIPWEERIPKAFFRGRDSNKARLDLVKKYRNQTDLFNVSLTAFFFHEYKEEIYGPKNTRVSMLEFFKYKYQINIDGTVAAYRFPYLMAAGSLIFKQDSEYYEHYYHDMQPWVHYIPLKKDISDIEEKLHWAIEHDDEAKQIAANAYQFAQDHLLPDKLYCYFFTLLKEYAQLQQGTPKIHDGMLKVEIEDKVWQRECKLCPVKSSKVPRDEF